MKMLVALLLSLGLFAGNHSTGSSVAKEKSTKSTKAAAPDSLPRPVGECPDDLCLIYGRIQFVDSFPDCEVEIVSSFEDMRVQVVDSFADDVAKWEIVDSFPNYKIQIVDSFPDFTIRYVDSFPGVDGD